ncbi:MAG: NAD(P)/FAD-dependent oxidoreductase [Pseudomonadota bacterium]
MQVVILGNGVAGATAALHLRQLQPDWRIVMVSGESTHHYSRPALMYLFMGHLRYSDCKPFEDRVWQRERIALVRDWVTRIDVENGRLELLRGQPLAFDRLLIATGSEPNRFGWPGQDLEGVQGLWGLGDLHRLVQTMPRVERAVVVGGGLIGIELGEMLHSRGVQVTFLVREPSYWNNVLPDEESVLVNRLIRRSGMELRLNTELSEILDDGQGRVAGVMTGQGDRLRCQLVGLTAGVRPNITLLHPSGLSCARGVLVDASLRSSVPEILAAGDCAEIRPADHEQTLLQQVWYTGKAQGRVAAEVLAGREATYQPDIWFNSAKFLNLEYQTYGQADPRRAGAGTLYWQHPDQRHALRIVHADAQIAGFNALGLRLRHRVCERWIREQRSVSEVLDHLADAAFDPELFHDHLPAVTAALRSQL